jgi:hypothetical protein
MEYWWRIVSNKLNFISKKSLNEFRYFNQYHYTILKGDVKIFDSKDDSFI